jgi:hypothetical protein
MIALSHILLIEAGPTQVALADPCLHRPWEMGRSSNPRTLAEPRVR